MKILLDEFVTQKLKQHLTEFDVNTVVEMGWSGLKNGDLLSEAVRKGFDVLLTIDKNIEYQQNVDNFDIAIVVLDVERSKIDYLLEKLPSFKKKIEEFDAGNLYLIEK